MKKIMFFCILSIPLFTSCETKELDSDDDARNLFRESAVLIQEVINKIPYLPDSLSVDSIMNRYDKQITDINFSFPPETDFKLTEEENDSLFKLIQIMERNKDEKLKQLSLVVPDTIIQE